MTTLPVLAPHDDCWNQIGVRGDRSCPELATVGHCHNCPVFAAAGRRFLDGPCPDGYLEEWTQRLAAPVADATSDLHSVLIFRLSAE
jgi:chemotaxis-related protein WspD